MDTPTPFTPEQLIWLQGRLPREVADAPLLDEPHSGSRPPGLPGPSGASPQLQWFQPHYPQPQVCIWGNKLCLETIRTLLLSSQARFIQVRQRGAHSYGHPHLVTSLSASAGPPITQTPQTVNTPPAPQTPSLATQHHRVD